MFNNSPSLKIFCVVAILSFTLTHPYELFDFQADLFYNVENLNHEKNVIISPLVVETVLGLMRFGAQGETAAEINKPFGKGYKKMKETFIEEFYKLSSIFLENPLYGTIDKKLYIDENLYVKEEFKKLLTQLRTSIEAVDFLCAEETADSINEWVKRQTNDSITQIVQLDTFTEDTKLLLVNAITFNGVWKYKFNEVRTASAYFYLNQREKTLVPMMSQLGYFFINHHPNLKATSLILPYENFVLSFVIFLPDTYADFNFLKTTLKNTDIRSMDSGTEDFVHVYLPRFKVEFEHDLKTALRIMGLGKSFSDSGDFGGILKYNDIPLSVSKFIHKVVINVDEKGSYPEQATENGEYNNIKTFNANRPFIYIIKNIYGDIVFSGSYKGFEN